MARRLRPAVCLAVVAACALAPSGAEAITIGVPNLTPATGSGLTCSMGATCSFVQTSPSVAAPFDGVLTRWRIRVLGGPGTAQLRILRPEGAALLWLSSGAVQNVNAPDTAEEPLVHAFEMHTAVQSGDQIGVTIQGAVVLIQDASNGYAGASLSIWNPQAADGTSPPPTGTYPAAIGLNADVERDNDGDTLGDETQDPDDDNDGAADASDNCPTTVGASQADADGDGQGDVCDPDDDNDGLPDTTEAALGSDPSNPDTDGDGNADGSDRCLLRAGPGGCPGAAVLALKAPARLKRRAFTGGVRFTVTPDQPVALRVSLVAPGRGRGTILAEASLALAPGARSIRLKPSRRAARGVKRVQLRVLAINAEGAQTELRRTIRVRR